MTIIEAVQEIERILTPKKVTMIDCQDVVGYKFKYQLNGDKINRFVDFENPVKKVLDFMNKNQGCGVTYREIKRETELDDKTLRKVLNHLINLNEVTKFSENKKGVWCFYYPN
jgi:hypothetical protein